MVTYGLASREGILDCTLKRVQQQQVSIEVTTLLLGACSKEGAVTAVQISTEVTALLLCACPKEGAATLKSQHFCCMPALKRAQLLQIIIGVTALLLHAWPKEG